MRDSNSHPADREANTLTTVPCLSCAILCSSFHVSALGHEAISLNEGLVLPPVQCDQMARIFLIFGHL